MPSLADLIAHSQQNISLSNADLTPEARRHRMGVDAATPAGPKREDFGRGGHMPTPNGPVESDTDRLLAEAKGTLAKADPFARMLQNSGNVAAEQSREDHGGGFNEAAIRSLGDTSVGVMKGAAQIPGDLLGGMLGLPGTIAHGLASIPEGLSHIIDPATWRGMPDAVKQQFAELANDPETATRLFGGMIAAGPAADVAGSALSAAPGLAGRAISATGRGVQAVGASPLVKGTGMLRKMGAVFHPGLGTAAAAIGPELLEGAGRGIESFGNKVSNIPNSAAMAGLRKVGNTDLGALAKDTFTPRDVPLTADEQAAGSVRATVGAAKNGVAKGLSRAQADQRAGWPLGESSATKHTTPGADVEANRPYAPAVRGVGGNVIQEGRGSLGGLEEAVRPRSAEADAFTKDAAPEVYAKELLDQPGSQTFMNNEHAANTGVADDALGKNRSFIDLGDAEQAKQAYLDAVGEDHGPEVDITHELAGLSNLDRASRLARARSAARAGGANTPFAERY